ncbi:MAG: single-stranded-DNA-specific exonuclease RecJ [Lachnospiraceae bacterium]|nr:single-stranded-DNA-specific exonuclease RecJ [Lachnospiraceae bacterium]
MKREKWVVSAKKADFHKIAETFGIDPVIARIIRNRDVVGDEAIDRFLHGDISQLYAPDLLGSAREAAAFLKGRIEAGARIRIIGDYDIDGVMSTHILSVALRRCGADFDAVIPHRMKDGYGLSDGLIDNAIAAGVDTILTCDNGIAAMKQIADAKAAGMHVVITDHHEVPFEEKNGVKHYILPPADVIVDPKCEGDPYPQKEICGATVAMKVMQLLLEEMAIDDALLREEMLECAAFATVGDVMPLCDENRILVRYGLKKMENSVNVGLRALIAASDLANKPLTAFHIGFVLGPCLNAAGRLDTAYRGLALLDTRSFEEAMPIASELRALNENRKEMTLRYIKQAENMIDAGDYDGDRVLVVYLPDCHESLAGIIAGRIREKYGKPVFVLTDGENGVKGSGRSIDAYNMYEEMTKCADLFTKFGGHPMAAGLSLPKENVDAFRAKINDSCTLTEDELTDKVTIDVPMPLCYVNRRLIDQLSLLEPFGTGNPKPVFAEKNLRFLDAHAVGSTGKVVKIRVRDEGGRAFELTYFGDGGELFEAMKTRDTFSVLYYPGINSFRGMESIQYVMQGYC